MFLLESCQSIEHCLRHGGPSWRRSRLPSHMHDQRLLHCNQFMAVLSIHAQKHMHPLLVNVEDLAIDEEFIAELAFPVKTGPRFERVDRAIGFLPVLGVEAKKLIQPVAGPTENDVIGEIAHVPVVVDPLGRDPELENLWQLAHAAALYASGTAKNQWALTARKTMPNLRFFVVY